MDTTIEFGFKDIPYVIQQCVASAKSGVNVVNPLIGHGIFYLYDYGESEAI